MINELAVCNMKYERITDLTDNVGLGPINVEEIVSVNEISTLTFEFPIRNPKTRYLINENLILFNDEYYVIKTPTITHSDEAGPVASYACNHLSETLQNNIVSLSETTPRTCEELMKLALVYSDDGVPTLGWKIGAIGIDSTIKRGLENSEQSSFATLAAIADKFNGMLLFHSKTRTVDMVPINTDAVPKHHLRVRKNLKSIEVTYDTSEMVTRLYCFGYTDKNGNELNVMGVNPTGKPYIDNFDYFYGLGYTDDDIGNFPELFIKTNIWRDENYYYVDDLFEDGKKELAKVAVPKVNIVVDALQYNEDLSTLQLGDCVRVVDEDISADFMCNVTKRIKNHSESHIVQIEITNTVDYRNVISEMFTSVSTMNQVVTNGGTIIGSAISGITTDQIYDLAVKYASFEYLDANYIDAQNIAAMYATIEQLNAYDAVIENIISQNLVSINAKIQDLEANKLSVEDAKILYANIDFSNISEATMQNFYADSGLIKDVVIENGTITGHLVGVTITGELIQGGTVKADKLVILGEDGLYYKLNTNGETVETEQTDENSLNGELIMANTITASKINVQDLVAFGATIGGFKINDNAIYSGVKESVNNTTNGICLTSDGQIAIGDADNFFKYYKDENGNYKLEISADSIAFGTDKKPIDLLIQETKQELLDEIEIVNEKAEEAINNTGSNIEIGVRNLIVRNTELEGYYIDSNGELAVSSYNSVSNYIVIQPSTDYMFSKNTGEYDDFFRYAWYDEDQNFIASSSHYDNALLWTSPSNAHYIRISYPSDCNVKFERGNKMTDWSPAPEDVEASNSENYNTLNNIIIEQNSTWTKNMDSIESTVEELSVTTNGYESRITTVEQTASGTSQELEIVKENFGDLTGTVNSYEEIWKHFETGEDGLIIKTSKTVVDADGQERVEEMRVRLDSGLLEFFKGGDASPFGSWNGSDFYTNNIILNDMQIAQFGSFAWVPRNNGSLSLLKVR